MRKKILTFFIFLLFSLSLTSSIFAQEKQNALESCFNFYDYGKIQAHLTPEKTIYNPGETAKIQGTIVNNNTFPLVDVVLYAHIKRVNKDTFYQNGHFLINRLTLKENLSFLPAETKWITFDLPILPSYPNGDYQIHYFLFAKNGFHYGGRPFVEEDTAGYSTFTIEKSIEPLVYFDIDSFRVNGQTRSIRQPFASYPAGSINLAVSLVNNLKNSSAIPVKIKWYSFEDTFESLLVASEAKLVSPDKKTLFLTFTPPAPGAYVLVAQIDQPVTSIFKYRFASTGEGGSQLRLNDIGVTDFPVKDQSRAWVCFHSPTNSHTSQTELTLSVLDSNRETIAQKTVTRDFSPEVKAISVPLSNLTTPENFTVQAQFLKANDPSSIKTVEVSYDCSKFKSSVSQLEESFEKQTSSLNLQGVNPCGEKTYAGYLESIFIADKQGNIQRELYNLFPIPEKLALADLEAGDYQAKITSGQKVKLLDFKKPKAKGQVWLKVVVLTLSGVLIFGFIYLLMRWRKKSLSP